MEVDQPALAVPEFEKVLQFCGRAGPKTGSAEYTGILAKSGDVLALAYSGTTRVSRYATRRRRKQTDDRITSPYGQNIKTALIPNSWGSG
jgi:hypothetical protein